VIYEKQLLSFTEILYLPLIRMAEHFLLAIIALDLDKPISCDV